MKKKCIRLVINKNLLTRTTTRVISQQLLTTQIFIPTLIIFLSVTSVKHSPSEDDICLRPARKFVVFYET